MIYDLIIYLYYLYYFKNFMRMRKYNQKRMFRYSFIFSYDYIILPYENPSNEKFSIRELFVIYTKSIFASLFIN